MPTYHVSGTLADPIQNMDDFFARFARAGTVLFEQSGFVRIDQGDGDFLVTGSDLEVSNGVLVGGDISFFAFEHVSGYRIDSVGWQGTRVTDFQDIVAAEATDPSALEDFIGAQFWNIESGPNAVDHWLNGLSSDGQPMRFAAPSVFYLGDGDDRFTGADAQQIISGAGGDDLLGGGRGDDILDGGTGNDLIRGGGDDDVVNGGIGNDVLLGNGGNDTIDGGAGNDRILGGAGNDSISGGSGTNIIVGGAGADRVIADGGVTKILGGTDVDRFDFVVQADSAARAIIFDFDAATEIVRIDGDSGAQAAATITENDNGVRIAVGDDVVLVVGADLATFGTDQNNLFFI